VLIISINVDYIYVNKFNRYGDGLLIEAKPVAIQAIYDNAYRYALLTKTRVWLEQA
jgi:hypothetical protein